MTYSVGEMAKLLGVASSTLRYYDQQGLLPFVERTSGGIRVFKESDFEWLKIIDCLKKTGMKLTDIKQFVVMALDGDDTIEKRLELIKKQQAVVTKQIEELKETLDTLNFKRWYYETAQKDGTTALVRELSLDEIPEEYREIRKKLKGE